MTAASPARQFSSGAKILIPPRTRQEVFLAKPTNNQYTVEVEPGASLLLVLSSLPSVFNLQASVAQDSSLTVVVAFKTKAATKFFSYIRLVGRGAKVKEQTALVASQGAEIYVENVFEHLAPQTFGRVVSRRVQADNSAGEFWGLLKVSPQATGTDTYLSDKALLIGDKARATSVPKLEILTDEVKASHGTAVGKLSPEELFYLQSRGLDRLAAEKLLTTAFLEPALAGLSPRLRGLIGY
ncbi:MAG: SufD family Fe-S cluster assembly protein [Candidatus Kerfeldbacteria bacterium]|nr:SufD family Fe-S cluster assembly protein [Candidatus Kerfeldbacteria bacterium]